METNTKERIAGALDAAQDGGIDGAHHKMWVIDQIIRRLTGCPTVESVAISTTSGKPINYLAWGNRQSIKSG